MNDDDIEFENEYNVFERVEFMEQDILGELGVTIKEDAIRDPTQRFYIFVNTLVKRLSDQRIIKTTKADIHFILSKIKNVSSPKYKNPTGFVLGYYITENGQIDKKKFNVLKSKLRNLEYPLSEIDVLRYGSLWLTLRND